MLRTKVKVGLTHDRVLFLLKLSKPHNIHCITIIYILVSTIRIFCPIWIKFRVIERLESIKIHSKMANSSLEVAGGKFTDAVESKLIEVDDFIYKTC